MDELPSDGKKLLCLAKNSHDPPSGACERMEARLAIALALDPEVPEAAHRQLGSVQLMIVASS